jgi:hypothetical protein
MKLLYCVIALTLAFSGYAAKNKCDGKTGEVKYGGVDKDMVIADAHFSCKIVDKDSGQFVQINPNATLNDLNNFAVTKCWNGYLKKKVENASVLSQEDVLLLDFCINVQLNMIDALGVALLGDLTEPRLQHNFLFDMHEKTLDKVGDGNVWEIYEKLAEIIVKLKASFIVDNKGVRVPMKEWGRAYQSIPNEVVALVFKDVQENSHEARTKNGSRLREWWYRNGSTGLPQDPISTLFNEVRTDPLNKIEKEVKNHTLSAAYEGQAWQIVQKAVSPYLNELLQMWTMLSCARAKTEDSQTRNYIDQIILGSEKDKQAVIQHLYHALYDLPFAIQTYKARAKLKECKGFWNDNEKEMKRVVADYTTAVSGDAMLKHIRTRYAVNGYVELIKYFRSQLSAREFREFIREVKLYDVEVDIGKNSGDSNKISPIIILH